MSTQEAFANALEMADLVVTIDNVRVPAFYGMSDARICAVILHEQTRQQVYAREYQCDLLGKVVYVVY